MLSRRGRIAGQHKDPAWPFRGIAAQCAAADIAFINLESPFAATGPYFQERMVFRARPWMAEGLAAAGIDVVSTANNHARDAGGHGIEETLRVLGEHGIAASGTGATAEQANQGAILERRSARFGFPSCTFDQRNGHHPDDDPRVAMWHTPAVSQWVGWMQPRAAIDARADLVTGHPPRVVQPVEIYQGKLICYSLGNLIFQFHREDTQRGLVVETDFAGSRRLDCRLGEVRIERTVPRFTGGPKAP